MSEQPAYYSILWACLSSWYYGYHLSELNFPVSSLTCLSPAIPPPSKLPLCLGLDTHRYGLVTAVFTVGGLLGSLASSWVVQKQGVRGGIQWTGYLNLLGVAVMGLAPHWLVLALGRFIVGISSGIAVCLVPPFLAVIAKSSPALSARSGQVGSLHQLAIVTGLFSAQAAGLLLTGPKGDAPGTWRYVVALSGLVAIVQIILSTQVGTLSGEVSSKKRGGSGHVEGGLSPVPESRESDESSPLLETHSIPEPQQSIRELLSNTALRGPTILCASILTLQQLSGVNAVIFYSTPVLRPLMPSSAATIGLGVTGVNALMTVVAIFLIDRMGRKSLLLWSVSGMALTSAMLAFALDHDQNILSATAIILFIVSFAVGLGPIPFLLVSELVPTPGIPALASLSLSLSWISNFFIALLFLPLRDALSEPRDRNDPFGDRVGEGRVFFVFTGTCVLLGIIVWRRLGSGVGK